MNGKNLDGQQALNTRVFGLVHDDGRTQVALLLLRLGAGNVAQFGLISLNLPRSGYFEALFRAGVGLHLRHNKSLFLMERKGTAFQHSHKQPSIYFS
jgi:hypothetical protein